MAKADQVDEVIIKIPRALLEPLVSLIDGGLRSNGLTAARAAADLADAIQSSVNDMK